MYSDTQAILCIYTYSKYGQLWYSVYVQTIIFVVSLREMNIHVFGKEVAQ